jgi:phage terminase large subunit GpA-like protein
MDSMSDPAVREVVFRKGSQVAASEIIINGIGFYIEHEPSPQLLFQPTTTTAEDFSKDRIAPTIQETPCLRDKVADPKSRDSGNTILHKNYPGGKLVIGGANAPTNLASHPVRIVWFDEVDRYPASAGAEGDPIALGTRRTQNFWNRKVFLASTPTLKQTSRICRAFEASDQRHYYVPCPSCGEPHIIEFKNLHWEEGKPETASLNCPKCQTPYTTVQKNQAVRKGFWRAHAPFNGSAGFFLSGLYSPWVELEQIAREWEKVKDIPEECQTFINTVLGEPYEDTTDAFDWATLQARAEEYPYPVPYGVLCLTAGVDTQPDRLECEIVGHDENSRTWNIDYIVIHGDPDIEQGKPDCPWDELLNVIRDRSYTHACGFGMKVYATAIDSGGANTTAVYKFCKGRKAQRIFAIKGVSGEGLPIAGTPNRKQTGKSRRPVDLYPVGVDQAKAALYRRFKIAEPEKPAYCHFPTARPEEYFKQITSEIVVTRMVKGFPKREWTLPSGQRNEALDCRVYAMAAAAIVRPPWDRFIRIRGEYLKACAEPPVGSPGHAAAGQARPTPRFTPAEPSAEAGALGNTPPKPDTSRPTKDAKGRRRRRHNPFVTSW